MSGLVLMALAAALETLSRRPRPFTKDTHVAVVDVVTGSVRYPDDDVVASMAHAAAPGILTLGTLLAAIALVRIAVQVERIAKNKGDVVDQEKRRAHRDPIGSRRPQP